MSLAVFSWSGVKEEVKSGPIIVSKAEIVISLLYMCFGRYILHFRQFNFKVAKGPLAAVYGTIWNK